ncbi:uncharacterized protein LOC114355254 isoform X2 [Ostrinia furnacalis]|uniref:uncharacterized protein LOC114355254 isoform X2 n=1 Tax=Ostrinia furnacalis TaxID=93504 RepID=UPI00103894D2|nr:uncharacterized protein LOC114355254 isoform X2 [Ostrinia furnacalis]
MVNQNVLQDYSESIKRFRQQCLNSGISEEEFRNIYIETLQELDNKQRRESNNERIKTKYKVLLFLTIVLACCAYHYQIIYSCIVCHLQEYIYPGLRLFRKIAIPFISLFPSLTDLYHETCLIQNPFFTVVDMDCWPCSSVNNVREMINPTPNNQQNAPFIYEEIQQYACSKNIATIYSQAKGST